MGKLVTHLYPDELMKGKILEGKKFNVQQSKSAQSLPEGAVEIN